MIRKQLKFEKTGTGAGDVKGKMRIVGRDFFFKFNNNQYAQQVISQMQSKGAKISRGKGWIKVNIFGDNHLITIQGKEINIGAMTEEEIQDYFLEFYALKWNQAGFKCQYNNL